MLLHYLFDSWIAHLFQVIQQLDERAFCWTTEEKSNISHHDAKQYVHVITQCFPSISLTHVQPTSRCNNISSSFISSLWIWRPTWTRLPLSLHSFSSSRSLQNNEPPSPPPKKEKQLRERLLRAWVIHSPYPDMKTSRSNYAGEISLFLWFGTS